MNKKTLFALCVVFLAALPAMAQPGGGRFQRRTVEERVTHVHNFLDSSFNKQITAVKMVNIDSAFATYYRAQDKMRDEMMAASGGGRPDEATMEAMRTKMQELGIERDEKLQKVFTAEQYKKWKDELEAALQPRRGGPRGAGGGGGN